MECIYCGASYKGSDQEYGICSNCQAVHRVGKDNRNITLRDFFAGCALVGMTSSYGITVKSDRVDFANRCYTIADAMLKARGEHG